MARDNSPKERQRQQLERKQNQRASFDRILIVSEGSKTEPNYFNEIRQKYRISTSYIQVRKSELGTAPIQIVEYAEQLFINGDLHKRIQPRAFEQVYAVFDRDDHASYFAALTKAESLKGKLRNDNKETVLFKAVASVPCFELWLLLHYADIQAPIHRDDVFRQVKQYIRDYKKGSDNIFARTQDRLDSAIQRAQTLATRFTAYTDQQPYTGVEELVTRLRQLKTT